MIATNVLICFNYIWMVGMGIEPPSPYEIKYKYLDNGVQRHGNLCQYSKRKVKDLWMHDYV